MSWSLLIDYEQFVKNIPTTDPNYSQKVCNILESLRLQNDLTGYRFTKFCSAIFTRTKLRNKEISNEYVTKLNTIYDANSYPDIVGFHDTYYECLTEGPTARVLEYIEENLNCQNYHYELCTRCNPNAKTTLSALPVPEVSKESLKAMFCLYSVMSHFKESQFLHFSLKRAFSPYEDSNSDCHIGAISPNMIFQKVKHTLTAKLGYSAVESDPSLFRHDQYGLALVSRWEILVYSMHTKSVQNLFSNHFHWNSIDNNFTFMGYKINMNKYMLETNWFDYVQAKFSKMFNEYGLQSINTAAGYPTNGYFGYLESPPHGQPQLINKKFIDHESRYGGLTWSSDMDVCQSDLGDCKSMIGVLNYVAWNFRWDLQYYAAVLGRYSKLPNDIVYNALMGVFTYINSTRNFSTMYKPMPKLAPLTVDIYTDGHFKKNNPSCTYGGFIINISKRYWHSKSKRIVNKVENEFVSALSAAYDAVQYIALHQGLLKSLEQYTNKKIDYTLYIENDFLYEALKDVNNCELKASWKKRLTALYAWMCQYQISWCMVNDSRNPASMLTRDSNKIRDYLFENSSELRYAYEGYKDPSQDSDDSDNDNW